MSYTVRMIIRETHYAVYAAELTEEEYRAFEPLNAENRRAFLEEMPAWDYITGEYLEEDDRTPPAFEIIFTGGGNPDNPDNPNNPVENPEHRPATLRSIF